MMNINIKSTHFEMTPDIESHITEKMHAIERFLQAVENEEILVEVEVEKSTHQQTGEVYRSEANLTFKGRFFRAESKNSDVRSSIDSVQALLEKQIRRSKSKRFELVQKGARAIKKMLRKKTNDTI